MVDWLAGKRMKGTSSERTGLTTPAGVGGWVQVGKTTLSSNNQTISVASLPDKKYYMILSHRHTQSTGTNRVLRFNNDAGYNYMSNSSQNGGNFNSSTTQTSIFAGTNTTTSSGFTVEFISNFSGKEKNYLGVESYTSASGSGSSNMYRQELSGKYAVTTQINRIDMKSTHGDTTRAFVTGDEMIVLAYDPSDTHTTNYWEELADVSLSSAGDTIDAVLSSTKKYIWVQAYLKNSGNLDNCRLYLGDGSLSTTGNLYSFKHSTDGATDSSNTSMNGHWFHVRNAAESVFVNMFIINDSNDEKLIYADTVYDGGAGNNAPHRTESAGKWAYTSGQFDRLQIYNGGTGDFDTGSYVKVWGGD